MCMAPQQCDRGDKASNDARGCNRRLVHREMSIGALNFTFVCLGIEKLVPTAVSSARDEKSVAHLNAKK